MTEETRLAIVTDGSLSASNPFVPVDFVVPFRVSHWDFRGQWIERHESQEAIGRERFLRIQSAARKLPSTSQPSPGEFEEAYLSLIGRGFNQILVLTVPATKSGTYNSALLGMEKLKESLPETDITVFDTGTTAAGVEFMAEIAVKFRDSGQSLSTILDELSRMRGNIEMLIALDTLQFIRASGRIKDLHETKIRDKIREKARNFVSWAVSRVGKSPKLTLLFREGEETILWSTVSREFGGAVEGVYQRIHERALDGTDFRKIYIVQSNAEKEAQQLERRLSRGIPIGEITQRSDVPLALLAITGPKVLAAVCIEDRP